MKRLLTILFFLSVIFVYGQDSKPIGRISLQSPNNVTWDYNPLDQTIGMSKGTYKWNKFFSAKKVQFLIDSLDIIKQNKLTITNIGVSGPALLSGDTLNIPQYSGSMADSLKEDKVNKENTTISNDTIKYPTVNLLKTYADTKAPLFSGTTGFIPKFTGTNTIGNSNLFDNGTNIGMGYSTGTEITNNKLAVNGSIFANGSINSTGYKLNNIDLFGSLSAGFLMYWDGTKFNNTPYFRESDLSLTNPYVSRSGGIRINGDVKVTTGEGLEMWYEVSNMTSRIMAIDRGLTNTFHPIELYGSSFYFSQGNVFVGNLTSTNPRLLSASSTGQLTPVTDGIDGQFLKTNGVGVYTFSTLPTGNYSQQTLSGTNITWNLANGKDATITLTGNTVITLTNATQGLTGTIWVTNPSTVYTITFAGYVNSIDPYIRLGSNMVITSGGGKMDDYTFKYNGSKMSWNGTLDRH